MSEELTIVQNPLLPQSELLVEIVSGKVEHWGWETFVGVGMEARTLKDVSQWVLGRLALEVSKKYGQDTLGQYAKEIGVNKNSLLAYRWVVKQFGYKSLRIVNILPFQAFKVAAGTENPSVWITKAQDESWTAERLAVEIKKSKGEEIKEKPHLIICPSCGGYHLVGNNICQCSS